MNNSVGKLLERSTSDVNLMRIEKFAEWGRIVPDGVKNAGVAESCLTGSKTQVN